MEILNILAQIGDTATIVFAYLMWKMDRRLLLVELDIQRIKQKMEQKQKKDQKK